MHTAYDKNGRVIGRFRTARQALKALIENARLAARLQRIMQRIKQYPRENR
jgi:hypothetical protein